MERRILSWDSRWSASSTVRILLVVGYIFLKLSDEDPILNYDCISGTINVVTMVAVVDCFMVYTFYFYFFFKITLIT